MSEFMHQLVVLAIVATVAYTAGVIFGHRAALKDYDGDEWDNYGR